MPPALDLGVAGGILPLSCGNSPVIFLVVPSLLRCVCVEVPAPVLVHGGLYSPGLKQAFSRGRKAPGKSLVCVEPPRLDGSFTGAAFGSASVLSCVLRVGRFSPSLSRFSSPLGKRKRRACSRGPAGPRAASQPGSPGAFFR